LVDIVGAPAAHADQVCDAASYYGIANGITWSQSNEVFIFAGTPWPQAVAMQWFTGAFSHQIQNDSGTAGPLGASPAGFHFGIFALEPVIDSFESEEYGPGGQETAYGVDQLYGDACGTDVQKVITKTH
jgi:hypothetical protein